VIQPQPMGKLGRFIHRSRVPVFAFKQKLWEHGSRLCIDPSSCDARVEASDPSVLAFPRGRFAFRNHLSVIAFLSAKSAAFSKCRKSGGNVTEMPDEH